MKSRGSGCTPFDPLVDTETFDKRPNKRERHIVAPPSIRLWILKLLVFLDIYQKVQKVAPPSIRLWILKRTAHKALYRNWLVAPPSIRLWILKQIISERYDPPVVVSCTPFDPLVDTETSISMGLSVEVLTVAPPSIRLWILKRARLKSTSSRFLSCTPFDPLVDILLRGPARPTGASAETPPTNLLLWLEKSLHLLRSACGYPLTRTCAPCGRFG